jgi:mono/diheme cytochrome c family protein
LKYLCLLFALAFAACAGSIPKPSARQRDWVRAHYGQEKDIDRGYTLYVANCSGCHSLHHPSEYSDSAWAVVFPEMREKSKLNDADADLVLAYISSASAVIAAH